MRHCKMSEVALFTRAWIEIYQAYRKIEKNIVALFTRAWIEIPIVPTAQ